MNKDLLSVDEVKYSLRKHLMIAQAAAKILEQFNKQIRPKQIAVLANGDIVVLAINDVQTCNFLNQLKQEDWLADLSHCLTNMFEFYECMFDVDEDFEHPGKYFIEARMAWDEIDPDDEGGGDSDDDDPVGEIKALVFTVAAGKSL